MNQKSSLAWELLFNVRCYNFLLLISFSSCNCLFHYLNSENRNEALRVAFIDVVETLKDGKVHTEYFSKLVKADINGKDKVLFFFFSLPTFKSLR